MIFFSFLKPNFINSLNAGFYFIRNTLTVEEQGQWIRDSLISFLRPYSKTNHNPIYGPIWDLFMATKERKFLGALCNSSITNKDAKRWKISQENIVSSRGSTCKSI